MFIFVPTTLARNIHTTLFFGKRVYLAIKNAPLVRWTIVRWLSSEAHLKEVSCAQSVAGGCTVTTQPYSALALPLHIGSGKQTKNHTVPVQIRTLGARVSSRDYHENERPVPSVSVVFTQSLSVAKQRAFLAHTDV